MPFSVRELKFSHDPHVRQRLKIHMFCTWKLSPPNPVLDSILTYKFVIVLGSLALVDIFCLALDLYISCEL